MVRKAATPIGEWRDTVSSWLLILLISAFMGATLIWYAMGKSKDASEGLLVEYEKLLAKARERKREGGGKDDDDQEQNDESTTAEATRASD